VGFVILGKDANVGFYLSVSLPLFPASLLTVKNLVCCRLPIENRWEPDHIFGLETFGSPVSSSIGMVRYCFVIEELATIY
jgi:hypothetical protein